MVSQNDSSSGRRGPRPCGRSWPLVCGILPLACALAWYLAGMTLRAAPDAPAAKPAAAQPEPIPTPPRTSQFAYAGAGSCASGACHGGMISYPPNWKNSFSIWATQDRHARAYEVLFNDLARQIVQKLDRLEDPRAAKPQEDRRCLGCHGSVIDSAHDSPALRADGVSCEACHGSAEKWLVAHTLAPLSPPSEAARAMQALGMTNTKDLQVSAAACVKCHVGAPPEGKTSYEVNHDLIAAGHPRLNFELATLLAKMPRHWDHTKSAARIDDDPARIWAVGQLVTTRQALTLLDHQAQAAAAGMKQEKQIPWPEFADYDCYGCHHDLGNPQRNKTDAPAERKQLGAFVWGSWYTPMPPLIRQSDEKPGANALPEVVAAMGKPFPDPAAVRGALAPAIAELNDRLAAVKALKFDDKQIAQLMKDVAADDAANDWDHATQAYLALRALQNSRDERAKREQRPLDEQSKKIGEALSKLQQKLSFPTGSDAETGGAKLLFNSPRDYSPTEIAALIKKLHDLIVPPAP